MDVYELVEYACLVRARSASEMGIWRREFADVVNLSLPPAPYTLYVHSGNKITVDCARHWEEAELTSAHNETGPMMTPDQVSFLALCETKFADRYTDRDADFVAVKEASGNKPPIVEPWYNKPRREHNLTPHRNDDRGGDGAWRVQHNSRNEYHRQADRYYKRDHPYHNRRRH